MANAFIKKKNDHSMISDYINNSVIYFNVPNNVQVYMQNHCPQNTLEVRNRSQTNLLLQP